MSLKAVLTRTLLPGVMGPLRADFDIWAPGGWDPASHSELSGALAGAEIFCPTVFDAVSADLIQALPDHVKLIASFGVGTDHIDLEAARSRGLWVSNTPDVLTDETADLTLALMLSTARRFYEVEAWVRSGEWDRTCPPELYGTGLRAKALGIIGMGRIGAAVAERAKVFGMKVIYWSRHRKPNIEAATGAQWVDSKQALLAASDFVSLHCDLNDQTRHIIDRDALALMKQSAILINTGRGPLVDETALVEALRERSILGAGLDVFENEPSLAPGLVDLLNATLLPHIGSATHETRTAMGLRMKANMDAYRDTGRVLDAVVSPKS